MNALAAAMKNESNYAETENGAATLKSSLNSHVDLFSIIGASRDNTANAVQMFKSAFLLDQTLAMRILFWARDCRGGAGERKVFNEILAWLAVHAPAVVAKVMGSGVIENFGRFDDYVDLLCNKAIPVAVRKSTASYIKSLIVSGEGGLAAKWMPRKGPKSAQIRGLMGLTAKSYRQMVVAATNVVETPMCAKDWDGIVFSHVPSVAMARYTKAFARNAPEGFAKYKEALVKGDVKAKADALFPYDVVRTATHGDAEVADAQWNALPNFIESDAKIVPIIDVSGSMDRPASGSVTCMDVAIGLGIYIAERQNSVFKNLAITFHETPEFINIPDTNIAHKVDHVRRAPWGGSTNLQASFDLILRAAIENKVPAEDMPDFLFVVSDMEFNVVEGHSYWASTGVKPKTNFEAIDAKFAAAGYKRPNIIFWRVDVAPGKNMQTKFDENGTAMISGFSPSIIKAVLNAENVTPEAVMMQAVMADRYSVPGITI